MMRFSVPALLLWSSVSLAAAAAQRAGRCRCGTAEGRRARAAELVHRRPRRGRHLLLSADAASTPATSKSLGFAWDYDLGIPQRGQEATPIVVDGVMYTSGTWGYVYAVDAATGRELWRYDPKADYKAARNPCCDMVNRGVAVWKGRVYVASVDGRLHALDARDRHEDLGGGHHHRSLAALLEHRRAADRRRRRRDRQQRLRHGPRRRARLCLRL